MIRYVLSLLVFVLCIGCVDKKESDYSDKQAVVFGPKKQELSLDTNRVILEIRRMFEEINSSELIEKEVELSLDERMSMSSEGGQILEYFSSDSILKKRVEKYYGAGGQSIFDFYYTDDSVFFIFRRDLIYNSSLSEVNDDNVTEEQNRYYFYQGKLIRWIDEKKQFISPFSDSFREMEKTINENW